MKEIETATSIRLLDVSIDELVEYPDAISEIIAQRYTGLVVRGVLSASQCERAIASLGGEAPPVPRLGNPHFAGWSHGPGIVNAGDRLDEYFEGAMGLREGFAEAFDFDVVAHYEEIFRRVAGGRTVGTPKAPDGRSYSPITARALAETGSLPIHCGNETHAWSAMSHIASFIDTTDQLSFFTTLATPASGGSLIIYDVQHTIPSDPVMATFDGFNVSPELEARGFLTVTPGVGDMILFDGGRYFHRVVPVAGSAMRWTFGGFMAPDANTPHVWFWS